MSDIINWIEDTRGFMPHGHCYLWRPDVLWLNVGSDALIALSYFAIPAILYYFVRARDRQLAFSWIPLLFGTFIFCCGITHVLGIWTVWNPDYRLDGAAKLVTGVVSSATALSLLWVMPRALQLRSPRELEAEVQRRTDELAALAARLEAEGEATRAATAALQESDQHKDVFLATLAHELRNPLAPIRFAATMLTAESASPASIRQSGEIIRRQSAHMARLLEDLLDVARIAQGKIVVKREAVDLVGAINVAIESVMPQMTARAQRLERLLPSTPRLIAGDAVRLSQVFANLLANASKFSEPGSEITLRAELTERDISVSVIDRGIGIAPEALPHVFEMFAQTATDRSEGGLGIGLALVKTLVERHGGRITAESAGPGRGSQFTVTLPRGDVTATIAAPAAPAAPAGPAGALETVTRAGQARVLVADDNVDAVTTLALLLDRAGHAVVRAHDGREAVALASTQAIDVAIVDLGMPGLDGYAVARHLRALPGGAGALLIAASGWAHADAQRRAREAGFDVHLIKPVEPEHIERLIADWLRGRPQP